MVTADELAEYVHTQRARGHQRRSRIRPPTAAVTTRTCCCPTCPANASPATAPAPKFGTLVIEANMDDVEVFVDGKSVGVVDQGQAASDCRACTPGQHTVKGVKMGYEPDGPREETVYPGQELTVSIKILIARRRDKAARRLLDKGIEYYQKGYEQNYRKAAELVREGLQDRPHLQPGRTLSRPDLQRAVRRRQGRSNITRRPSQIDPDYMEAHADYAGMLLDIGNVDEAIRQLNTVLTREPESRVALTMLAQAYRFKDAVSAIDRGGAKAIQLTPKNAEPHLWLADSLRLSGKSAEPARNTTSICKLSDFDSKLAGQLNYYVLGSLFGIGKKKRAAQQDIWKDLRSLAYFGICDCQYQTKQYDSAIVACQKSLSYYHQDPYAHYDLALSYLHKAQIADSPADLGPALEHFRQVLTINPDLDQAKFAKQNITMIQKALGQ